MEHDPNICRLADHPARHDKTACLTRASVDMRAVGREVFRVRGGYLACLPNGLALVDLFVDEAAAWRAQEDYVTGHSERGWKLKAGVGEHPHPFGPLCNYQMAAEY
jgi:hypothetical protein